MSLCDLYGVSEPLLRRQDLQPSALHGHADEVEIAGALDLLAPRACGMPLIRLGGAMDGGYLVPDDLQGIDACFSPGVNNIKRFEDELCRTWGMRAYMCDFSSNVENFETPLIDEKQFFQKKWLDVDKGDDVIDINNWVRGSVPGRSDLLLQMDIEGAEYRNLINAERDVLARFRVIVLELHDLQHLARRDFLYGVFLPALRKITEAHVSVHVHANNACGEVRFSPRLAAPMAVEVTFLRKDRLRAYEPPVVIPHPLDQLNVHREAPIRLEGPWLRHASVEGSRLAALEQSVDWLASQTRRLRDANNFLLRNFVPRTPNLSLSARVSQSSRSSYSTVDDARGAADGSRTGSYGFHTDIESNPWWMADLGQPCRLEACLIFNRMDGAAIRARTLQLWTSVDGVEWRLHYSHSGQPVFGGVEDQDGMPPLLVDFRKVEARFVKLNLTETTAFHLDEIEIYGEPCGI